MYKILQNKQTNKKDTVPAIVNLLSSAIWIKTHILEKCKLAR